eukprot:GFUD01128056.1.p2 GENE.GFUD01128056.1~~GFUD01128056.1.p2  ORF type:complete len:101 (-),score=14.41 GFUD01128056.1:179-481(-)
MFTILAVLCMACLACSYPQNIGFVDPQNVDFEKLGPKNPNEKERPSSVCFVPTRLSPGTGQGYESAQPPYYTSPPSFPCRDQNNLCCKTYYNRRCPRSCK